MTRTIEPGGGNSPSLASHRDCPQSEARHPPFRSFVPLVERHCSVVARFRAFEDREACSAAVATRGRMGLASDEVLLAWWRLREPARTHCLGCAR